MEYIVRNARITFPKILPGQEEQFEGKGDPYWSARFIIARDHPDLPGLKAAITEVTKKKHPNNYADQLKAFAAKDKLPIHDGDLLASKPYGAPYAGNLYVSARNNAETDAAPTVFAAEIDPATGERRAVKSINDPYFPYSGAYVDVKLTLFCYNQGGGQGVGARISGIAFREHGERLAGGAVAAASDFEKIPETAATKPTGKGAADLF